MKAIDRFMSKTSRVGECLEWTGGTNSEGYGYFKVDGRDWRSTRWIFQFDHGYLPPVVMHVCDNPACVDLKHLIPGTQADNMTDKMAKGRHRVLRGQEAPMARLSDTEVSEIRSRCKCGDPQVEVARDYGVHPSHVSRIVNNQARKAT